MAKDFQRLENSSTERDWREGRKRGRGRPGGMIDIVNHNVEM